MIGQKCLILTSLFQKSKSCFETKDNITLR